MKKYLVLIMTITVSFLLLQSCKEKGTEPQPEPKPPGYQEDIPWPSLADSPWPMHHGNPQFTGRSRYPGPKEGIINFEKIIPIRNGLENNLAFLSPIVKDDSTIFFISMYENDTSGIYLYSIDSEGLINWKIPITNDGDYVGSKITSPPIIANFDAIYIADWNSNLFSFKINGELLWQLKLESSITSTMNIDKEGNLYAGASNGTVYSISQEGEINWSLKLDSFISSASCIAFSADGKKVYVPGHYLYAIGIDGVVKWKSENEGEYWNSAPLVDSEGNVYVSYLEYSSRDIHFTCFDKNGNIKYTTTDYVPLYRIDPTIDLDGNLYMALTPTEIISLDYDGNLRWQKEISWLSGAGIISDCENNIFVFSKEKVTKIDNKGNQIFDITYKGETDLSPAISSDETINFGTNGSQGKYFYSIK